MEGYVGVGVGGIIIGLFLLVSGLLRLRRTLVTSRWLPTRARVIHTEVVGIGVRLPRSTRSYSAPRVVYRYKVDGQAYEGRFEDAYVTPDLKGKAAYDVHSLYPKGKIISIRYDPGAPERSAPPGTSSFGAFAQIVTGLMIFAIGCAAILTFISGR